MRRRCQNMVVLRCRLCNGTNMIGFDEIEDLGDAGVVVFVIRDKTTL